ncbi:MAG: O-acetyl-ADP-ribose deacetylase [Bacillota bacterium]|nr:O-acetyl-ADP-ribose deacetylase [Bacillota bacterium]
MPFQIIHNDITKMNTGAIVNAANSYLQQGGGVCGAIFQAAGAELLKMECDAIGSCPVGNAVITKGYRLPAKYIIHAVGPVWKGGDQGEDKLLAMAYHSSLEIALEYHLDSISFPLISSGIYGYPKDKALQVAISVISEFLLHNDMDIYLVVFDRKAISLSEKLFTEINHYIDTYYEDNEEYENRNRQHRSSREFDQIYDLNSNLFPDTVSKKTKKKWKENAFEKVQREEALLDDAPLEEAICYSIPESALRCLDDVINQIEETFSEMMFRLIDEKGKADVEVYKRANIDRKLFSKMRNKNYQPKKSTALALAIALELSLDETKDFLMKAGYTLSNSNRFDLIIRFFIENKSYDMYIINEALFAHDQPLLGA